MAGTSWLWGEMSVHSRSPRLSYILFTEALLHRRCNVKDMAMSCLWLISNGVEGAIQTDQSTGLATGRIEL